MLMLDNLSSQVFLNGEYDSIKIDAFIEQDVIWYSIQHASVLDILNTSDMTRYSFQFYEDGSCVEMIYDNNEELSETHTFSDRSSASEDIDLPLPKLRVLSPGKKIHDGWKQDFYYQKVNDSIYYYVGSGNRYLIKNSGQSSKALKNIEIRLMSQGDIGIRWRRVACNMVYLFQWQFHLSWSI